MFRIELQIAEGVNFPYYVMGKAQLRVLPFADPWVWVDPQADPYLLFAQDYGIERYDVGDVEALWYGWLSQVSSSCPDDAREGLKYGRDPQLPIAQSILPEYLSRWPGIQAKLAELLRAAPSEAELSAAIRRNEQLFGLSYPEGGREVFHFNHFPTTATQKPGPHFVFGMGCLSRPDQLLQDIVSEVGLTLLGQILKDERLASHRRQIEAITEEDRYVQGYGSLLEALNVVVRAIEKRGDEVTLDDLPRKPGEQGYQRIAESLFHNRQLWPAAGLVDFVCTALEGLR